MPPSDPKQVSEVLTFFGVQTVDEVMGSLLALTSHRLANFSAAVPDMSEDSSIEASMQTCTPRVDGIIGVGPGKDVLLSHPPCVGTGLGGIDARREFENCLLNMGSSAFTTKYVQQPSDRRQLGLPEELPEKHAVRTSEPIQCIQAPEATLTNGVVAIPLTKGVFELNSRILHYQGSPLVWVFIDQTRNNKFESLLSQALGIEGPRCALFLSHERLILTLKALDSMNIRYTLDYQQQGQQLDVNGRTFFFGFSTGPALFERAYVSSREWLPPAFNGCYLHDSCPEALRRIRPDMFNVVGLRSPGNGWSPQSTSDEGSLFVGDASSVAGDPTGSSSPRNTPDNHLETPSVVRIPMYSQTPLSVLTPGVESSGGTPSMAAMRTCPSPSFTESSIRLAPSPPSSSIAESVSGLPLSPMASTVSPPESLSLAINSTAHSPVSILGHSGPSLNMNPTERAQIKDMEPLGSLWVETYHHYYREKVNIYPILNLIATVGSPLTLSRILQLIRNPPQSAELTKIKSKHINDASNAFKNFKESKRSCLYERLFRRSESCILANLRDIKYKEKKAAQKKNKLTGRVKRLQQPEARKVTPAPRGPGLKQASANEVLDEALKRKQGEFGKNEIRMEQDWMREALKTADRALEFDRYAKRCGFDGLYLLLPYEQESHLNTQKFISHHNYEDLKGVERDVFFEALRNLRGPLRTILPTLQHILDEKLGSPHEWSQYIQLDQGPHECKNVLDSDCCLQQFQGIGNVDRSVLQE